VREVGDLVLDVNLSCSTGGGWTFRVRQHVTAGSPELPAGALPGATSGVMLLAS
jgi:hypothetical protein